MSVTEEFQDIRIIKGYDLKEVFRQLYSLQLTQKNLRLHKFEYSPYQQKLNYILEDSNRKIQIMIGYYSILGALWSESAKYLGEDLDEYNQFVPGQNMAFNPNKRMATSLFSTLNDFFESFEEAAVQLQKQKEGEERRKKILEESIKSREEPEKLQASRKTAFEASEMFKRFSVLQHEHQETAHSGNDKLKRLSKNMEELEY